MNATSASAAADRRTTTAFSLEGERREVTVLFADLVGSTALGERIGDEAVYALTRDVFAGLVEIVEARGGRLAEFSGDGLMALFGGPVALDDAALVACRTAIDMVSAIGNRSIASGPGDRRLRLRVGISTGLAVVGEIGLPRKIDLTAIGDTVNLAARLQQLAAPDEVIVEGRTHGLVASYVDAVPLGSRSIRGRKSRVAVFRLLSVQRHRSRFDWPARSQLPLVGRSREWQWLLQHRDAAGSGTRFAGIVGDAGIGKSRLAFELWNAAEPNSGPILVGNCLPDGRQTPFLPIVEILRQALDLAGPDGAAIEARIGASLGPALASPENVALLKPLFGAVGESRAATLDPTLAAIRLRELLFEWMHAIRRSVQATILLEDVHWIDQPSHDLVERLVAAPGAAGLVLWTSRTDGQPRWRDADIRVLVGLDEASTVAFVCAELGVSDLPSAFTRFLVAKSGGNPLFAEAIARLLLERGDLRRGDDGFEFRPPPDDALPPGTVQNLIVERVDRLPRETKAVLQAASVIGRRFSTELLAEIVARPVAKLRTALGKLARQGFLVPDEAGSGDAFQFQHALVRDVLYGTLLESDRSAIHALVAERLERRVKDADGVSSAPILAYHYSRSRNSSKAIRYLTAAGRAALATYSIKDASLAFEMAMARVDADPSRVEPGQLAELLQGWMRVLELEGRFRDIRVQAERHLPRIESVPPSQAAVLVHIHYAHALAHAHRYAEAHAAANTAIAKGEQLGDAFVVANARLILMKVVAKTRIGLETDAAKELGLQIVPVAERQSDNHLELLTLFELANNQMHRGLVPEARRSIQSLVDVGERRNDPRARAYSLWMLGWLALQEGRYDDALSDGEASFAAALTRTDELMATVVKGTAMALLGRPRDAVPILEVVRDEATANEDFNIVSAVDSVLGIALSLSGHLAAGVARIKRAIARGETTGYITSAAYGRLTLAEVYCALASRARKSSLRDVVRNLRFLILAIPRAQARARQLLDWVEGCGQFESEGVVGVRIALCRGVLAASRKDREQAAHLLDRARSLAADVGAHVYEERATVALGRLPAGRSTKPRP